MKKVFIFILISFFVFCNNVDAYSRAPIDITTMSITELQDAMEKGYITSELLVSLYLERINEYDGMFNSIRELNPSAIDEAKKLDAERKLDNVKGPLHGIPILVKTNIDIKGIATTAGTKSLSDNYPNENAYVIQKLVDAGAIILGSTNMSELAFSASNSYSSYGYVRNVFNTDYTSYGSSGGSAVSVAAAFAAASLGTDTNSSVRVPAAGAGLVGMRPTIGLVSRSGVIPYDVERDTVGVLSKTVSDNALILSVISGEDKNDSYTKNAVAYDYNTYSGDSDLENITIGVILPFIKGSENASIPVNQLTDPVIYELIEKSIISLENTGANIVYLDEFLTFKNYSIASSTQAGITMCDGFNEYIKGTTGSIRSFEELAKSKGHIYSLSGYVAGCDGGYQDKSVRDEKKGSYREDVDKIFNDNGLDVIVYPTLKNLVFQYNETGIVSPSSSLSSVIGYPSITVPMGIASDGFSYGIEFLSKAFEEDKIYDVAAAFESTNGNKIINSNLTPSLYEVPEVVSELIVLYETGDFNNNELNDLQGEIEEYFRTYNDNEKYIEDAQNFITRYDELKKQSVKFKIINVLIFAVVVCFLSKIWKIVRRVFRKLKRRKKKVTRR
ncbi:MAG: amidase [Bacilli bacterium]|nr:amidase [Bacilli bacterium]